MTLKTLLIIITLGSCVTCFSQQEWEDMKKNSIPPLLEEKLLKVEKFELSALCKNQKKVDIANRKLEIIFKRYYPFNYQIVDTINSSSVDSNCLFFKNHQEMRSYNTTTGGNSYLTNKYYFYDPITNKRYDDFGIYSSIRYKTLKEILKAIKHNIAGKRKNYAIKFAPISLIKSDLSIVDFAIERRLSNVISGIIGTYFGQFERGAIYNVNLRTIEPGLNIYAGRLSLSPLRGVYLGLSPVFVRMQKGTEVEKSSGFKFALGIQTGIFDNFLIDFNLKLSAFGEAPMQPDFWQSQLANIYGKPFNLNGSIKLGYNF